MLLSLWEGGMMLPFWQKRKLTSSIFREWGDGMLLPFLAHGLADCYIFSILSWRTFDQQQGACEIKPKRP
jgi:hypothetical protein